MPQVALSAFNVRGASKRAKLIIALANRLGEQVPMADLMQSVYGHEHGSKSAFASIVEGLDAIIERYVIPYKIVRVKIGKENTLGLYSTTPGSPQSERKKVA